ncbi:hypothetical protein NDU88_005641 [Pleurodeles waltl]|uniref:Uncharacterized protein n=1 Tax=Pleurodeles waltl TaxID=8319 RepID=A0AAV7UIL6_PLEWA|nr:hypothetical protein NDU88_005641 [Pleurodeles waltl]
MEGESLPFPPRPPHQQSDDISMLTARQRHQKLLRTRWKPFASSASAREDFVCSKLLLPVLWILAVLAVVVLRFA